MARPQNTELKSRIREARAKGASIDALMADFGLSRNTVFYHLREDPTKDSREHYTKEERQKIARMSDDELREYAPIIGKTFIALQRVAYRTRKSLDIAGAAAERAKIELRGYVDFGMESELRLFGLSQEQVELASKRLLVYRLRLVAPNKLVTLDGKKFCTMKLGFQKAIVTDTIKTLTDNAAKIKQAWRTFACPACGREDLGLRSRADQSTYRVCACGWNEDTGRVEPLREVRHQGYRSECE